ENRSKKHPWCAGKNTSCSGDSEDCAVGSQGRVPTQKSYSSSETLRAFDHTTRRYKGMVQQEQDSYSSQGQHFRLRQLGICEPPPRCSIPFCSDIGLPHRGFSVGPAHDLDTNNQSVMSPEQAMQLWGHGGLGKSSGRSSCLSSRSNSVLTLTDTEHENKSDSDNGRTVFGSHVFYYHITFLNCHH
uniref:Teneurin-3 n=1 Tax=Nothobranchius furzeri TaxID=105023 RepID=A0A8C6Q212_NOTFU